jgi:hypothetical protein
VEGHVEGEPETILVQAEEVLPEQEVPGARDRQELGEPLNHAEQDRF